MKLNDRQKEAVLIDKGPLLILAGAGSGKTRTLVSRIENLIGERGYPSYRILAITFTNKAANEMKDRLIESLGEEGLHVNIGTFHSICSRILRKFADKIGFEKDFTIYDSYDQLSLIKQCAKELNIDIKEMNPKFIRSSISSAKNTVLRRGDVHKYLDDDLHEVFNLYEARMKEYNAMDFDNIILHTIELLEKNTDVLEYYRDKYLEVLVDEYQDTNMSQYYLVYLLTKDKGNVVVVGDVDQSIYGWRGANIRNILEFTKDFKGAKTILLEQNYRSTKHILEVANTVIEYNENRPKKNLWTDIKEGEKVRIYRALSDRDEAEYVVKSIKSDLSKGYKLNEIAILYRIHSISRIFEEKLRNENINYQIIGGLKFYERKEIKDAFSYIKLLSNPNDEIALIRAMNTPKRGFGPKTLEKIKENSQLGLYENMKRILLKGSGLKSYEKKVVEFVELIENQRAKLDELGLHSSIEQLLKSSGLIDMYKESDRHLHENRVDNLYELLNDISYFEKNNSNSLNDYLEKISLIHDTDNLEDDSEKLTLMTVHSSKGLEYDIIYLVGLEEGIFPSYYSEIEDGIEEERRLFYVGITRAKKKLVISHSNRRMRFSEITFMEPSKFLDELPESSVYFEGKKSNPYTISLKIPQEVKRNVEFSPADIVKHKIFGTGTVVSFDKESKVVVVAFREKGVKKLNINFAPLEKM